MRTAERKRHTVTCGSGGDRCTALASRRHSGGGRGIRVQTAFRHSGCTSHRTCTGRARRRRRPTDGTQNEVLRRRNAKYNSTQCIQGAKTRQTNFEVKNRKIRRRKAQERASVIDTDPRRSHTIATTKGHATNVGYEDALAAGEDTPNCLPRRRESRQRRVVGITPPDGCVRRRRRSSTPPD